jgi:hypothetical protein
MPRVVKVVLWAAAFAGCFGIGAYVAAHTNPFPPGVDPGVRPDPGATPSVSPDEGVWTVQIEVRTYHDLYVGGRCAANWRAAIALDRVDPAIRGSGPATLTGELRCDEPTAQIQAEQIEFEASGSVRGDELRFRLVSTSRSPVGAQDLSGLVKTLPTLRFRLPARVGAAASFDITVPDGDRGTYGAVGQVLLTPPDPTRG